MSTVTFVNQWHVEGGRDGSAIGPGGEVFVSVNNSHRIAKYGIRGELMAEWGGEGEQHGGQNPQDCGNGRPVL